MIRIRLFGSGELNPNGFRRARYPGPSISSPGARRQPHSAPLLHSAWTVQQVITEECRILDSLHHELGTPTPAAWIQVLEKRLSLWCQQYQQRFPQSQRSLLSAECGCDLKKKKTEHRGLGENQVPQLGTPGIDVQNVGQNTLVVSVRPEPSDWSKPDEERLEEKEISLCGFRRNPGNSEALPPVGNSESLSSVVIDFIQTSMTCATCGG